MKRFSLALVAAALGCAAGIALAQQGGGPGPGAGPAASAPRMGPGGGRAATRWGRDMTPGWSMMTPQERAEHRDRMRAMKTYDACKTYQAEHHAKMAERAKQRGVQNLPGPRRDPCAGLPQ